MVDHNPWHSPRFPNRLLDRNVHMGKMREWREASWEVEACEEDVCDWNNYVALFAATCQLWPKTILEHPRTLLVGCWINISLSLLHLILLSLPVVGSAPVFQASSPFCSYVVNANNGTGLWDLGCSNFGWSNGTLKSDGYPGDQFSCASEWELGLGRDTRRPVMRWTIMLAAIYAAVWISIAYLVQSEDFKASVVVCPGITNSTLGAQVLNNETCACVDIQRPLNLPIKTVLDGDSSALSRLISNF
ncbi:hypothetical protein BDZ45DRAFT_803182 [Acephala macrosclerotiorum]|nr:hypothetical protein BDZ45DRAFT_803182 [Acephala macrosclerotiorum]